LNIIFERIDDSLIAFISILARRLNRLQTEESRA
jgi:hypothetical protein